MQCRILSRLPASNENTCQVMVLFSEGNLKGAARKIDQNSDGAIRKLYASGDFTGKESQTLILHEVRGAIATRRLPVGLGHRKSATAST